MKIVFRGGKPKYKQISDSVIEEIHKGHLKMDDVLPSVNEMCKKYSLSRDTVIKSYNELKNKGVITSAPGKGYYISGTATHIKRKVLIILDELSDYKQILLKSLTENLSRFSSFEIVFHHHNRELFRQFITENSPNYSYLVVVLPLYDEVKQDVKLLKSKNVFIIDHAPGGIMGKYPGVYQDYKNDVFNALKSGTEAIKKYDRFVLVHSKYSYIVDGMIRGFREFCNSKNIQKEVMDNINTCPIQKNTLYLILDNDDLIFFVKKIKKEKLTLGKDIGLISYNETPLKEIIANGLSTISTDFNEMGRLVSEMIKNNDHSVVLNKSGLNTRDSI